jgi:hypothetical protein
MELSYNNKNLDKILDASAPHSVNSFIPNYRHTLNTESVLTTWQEDSGDKVNESNNDIEYKLNEQYFRSQSFSNFNLNNINALYAGCSFTFGMGLPDHLLWTSILNNKIEKYLDKKVEPFNIGFRGFSNYLIIKNIMSFIRTYGKPNFLFVVFPDCARDFLFNEKSKEYEYVFPRFFHPDKFNSFEVKYTKNFVYETNIVKSIDMIRHLEDFCEVAGVKLLWTTWYYPDFEIYQKAGFKNLVDTDVTFLQANTGYQKGYTQGDHGVEYRYDNVDNLKYWEVARDLVHPGSAWTSHISKELFGEFIK